MNQRHSNEGLNTGSSTAPSFGSNHDQQGGLGQGVSGDSEAASHQDLLDPDNQQWRNEQMRAFDEDYRNWRQERFRRFSDDFTNWRKARSEQAAGAGENRSAVLVAGPGSRSGSASLEQDDQTRQQNLGGTDTAGKAPE